MNDTERLHSAQDAVPDFCPLRGYFFLCGYTYSNAYNISVKPTLSFLV